MRGHVMPCRGPRWAHTAAVALAICAYGAQGAAQGPNAAIPSHDTADPEETPSEAPAASDGVDDDPVDTIDPTSETVRAAVARFESQASVNTGPGIVRKVSFADGRVADARDRVAIDAAVGAEASPETLDHLATALAENGKAGVDLELQPASDPGVWDVVIRVDATPRRVGRLRVTTAPIGQPDPVEERRLRRRIEGVIAPLVLDEGRVFHPWFERRDTLRITRYFIAQGYPLVRVDARRIQSPGVVDVVWRVTPGPRMRVAEVQIAGLPDGLERPNLETVAGQSADPRAVIADAEALRAAVCRTGRPDARVNTHAAVRRNQLDVVFTIEAGRHSRVSAVQVEGTGLPASTLEGLPLEAGDAWCPDVADEAVELLRGRLEAAARPDAAVGWRASPVGDAPERPVEVVLSVTGTGEVRIGRVWFAGNHVTRLDLLRQLVSVHPGRPYDPEAIDESVQTLRRSGLFRRVEVRPVQGTAPGTRHLVFTVIEREPFSIDLQQQSLTLHNLDLGDATTDVRVLRAGAALRGAGQRMRLYAQPDWQGLHVFDPYVLPLLGVEGRLDRRTRSFGADVEETWFDLEGAAALRLLDDRLRLLGALHYGFTFPEGVTSGAGLPVADDFSVYAAPGLRLEARFERLDDERVAYLGLRVIGHVWRALPALGSDVDLTRMGATVDLRFPLHRFEGDRHLVLGLRVSADDIERHASGELTAHQRLTPKIRGYESLRFDHRVGEEVLRLGGQIAFTGGAEVRVPLPYARRHALIPFVDGAAMGDRGRDPADEIYVAPGLTYAYSFFDERLEGYLRVAFPLRTDVELEYLAFGMDGSF